jgi:choice-of-anchor C domain-containing protein
MDLRRDYALVAAATILITVACSTAARANMATNPSFESGPPVPSGEVQLATGSTAINGWTVTRAPINYVADAFWEAAQGTRSISLNASSTPGGIAQSVATVAGIAYRVDFKLSGEPFTVPVVKSMRVAAAGQHADFTFDSSNNWHWQMDWAPHTFTFTATAASTMIEFYSLMNSQSPPVLDDITVSLVTTEVPRHAESVALAISTPSPAVGPVMFLCSLPVAGPVLLRVSDVTGRSVATLVDGEFSAGQKTARWDAAGAAPGVYFVTLRAPGGTVARRFALLR